MQDELTTAIATDLGISEIPADEQKELIAQFGEVALKASTLVIMNKLSEGKRGEFMKLAEVGNAKELKAFLDKEVPEHESLAATAVQEEVQRFRAFHSS